MADINVQAPNDGKTTNDDRLIFYGNVSVHCPSLSKVVRIFTSSTFTDTKMERNILMEKSYPKLKTFCQERGYEFQVVDMRWGVRDEATDDHMGTDLCLRELQKCQKISTGPNFVSLLSHKYGYRSLLREVDAAEFEHILDAVKNKEDKELLLKWFRRDDNAVPPVYLLTAVSKYLPDFVSKEREKKMVAKKIWWEESEKMQTTLATVAQEIFGHEDARKYFISVTEKEVEKGVLDNKDTASTCLWIKRTITDINVQTPCNQLNRYKECMGEEEKWRESQKLLSELRDIKMEDAIPDERILKYDVTWTEKGIDPEHKPHGKYLEKMSDDFEREMMNMIDRAVSAREVSYKSDPLYEECVQHVSFCQQKCRNFVGRKDTLETIKEYILGTSNTPLVVYGPSGCGKTSLIAIVAKQAWTWLNGHCAIVFRFIGTTADSSNVIDFLTSIVKQLQVIYGTDTPITTEMKWLSEYLNQCLGLATEEQKLLLIVDSLDQFDSTYDTGLFNWLPDTLPSNVKIVVSTLDDDQQRCLQKLQTKFQSADDCFVNVPRLSSDDVDSILSSWIVANRRTVTPAQRGSILSAFEKCSIPLFLKLCYDEACRWKSFTSPDETILQTTVRGSINTLFSRIETLHGKTFVSRALGYLTVSRNGLSTGELEDILSCDDNVLHDVYMYWTPPSRRLPPLLLVRLKADLEHYLVDRGSDGVGVFYWYHRQFIEAAKSRYCTDQEDLLHKGLAEFFSGVWANGRKKSFVDKTGMKQEADRLVSSQPIKFGNIYNRRKLNHLSYHRTLADTNVEALKKECLCNFEFLQAKLIVADVRHILEDFSLARTSLLAAGQKDTSLELIENAIQLSQRALIYDSYQLAPQLLNRLFQQTDLEGFSQQCENCNTPYLYPDANFLTPPGGQLVGLLAGHTDKVNYMDISLNSSTGVTSSVDDTVMLWDLNSRQSTKTIDFKGREPKKVLFACQDSKIIIQLKHEITVIEQPNWEQCYSIPNLKRNPMFCVAGKDKSILAVFQDNFCVLLTAQNRKVIKKVSHSEDILFELPRKYELNDYDNGTLYGSENYILVTDYHHDSMTVLNLKSKSFGPLRNFGHFDPDDFDIDSFFIDDDDGDEVRHVSDGDGPTEDDDNLRNVSKDDEWNRHNGDENNISAGLNSDNNCERLKGEDDVNDDDDDDFDVEDIFPKPVDNSDNTSPTPQNDGPEPLFGPLISNDEKFVIWAMPYESDISMTDIETLSSEQIFCKKYGCIVLHQEDIHYTADGKYIYSLHPGGRLEVLDSKTLEKTTFLERPGMRINLVRTNDMKTVYSLSQDSVVCVWDLTQPESSPLTSVPCLGYEILELVPLSNNRYVLCYTKLKKTENDKEIKNNKCFQIYDIVTKSVVRQAVIDGDSFLLHRLVDDKTIAVVSERTKTMTVVDTDSMKVKVVFEGRVCTYNSSFVDYDERGIAIVREDKKAVMIYDKDEPKPKAILSFEYVISCIQVNQHRKLLIVEAMGVEDIFDLIDLKTNTCLKKVDRKSLESIFCTDGLSAYTRCFSETDRLVKELKETGRAETFIRKYYSRHEREWGTSGELLKCVKGFKGLARVSTIDGSPYYLAHGAYEDDTLLKLMDRSSFECIANFNLDTPIYDITWCRDGKSFLCIRSAKIIHWNVHNTQWSRDLSSYPVLFQDRKCDLILSLKGEEDKADI